MYQFMVIIGVQSGLLQAGPGGLGGGDGDGTSAPPFFAKQVNLSQPGGQIMPTTVLSNG